LQDLGHTRGTHSRQLGRIKNQMRPKSDVNASRTNQSN